MFSATLPSSAGALSEAFAGGDVDAYGALGHSLEGTARELFVHANTVRYRLKRVAEVTGWDPPQSFRERMIRGPLGAWDHMRTLKQVGQGTGALVELIEEICFKPPEGLAGLLLTESVIMTSLESGFAHRHRRLREILEAST